MSSSGTQAERKRVNDLEIFGHGQELFHACGDFRANAVDFGDIFFLSGDERVNRREFRSDNLADAFADMTNAQGEQYAAKRLLL